MSILKLANTDFESKSQNVSRLKVHNFYLSANPLSEESFSYVSRPTLSPKYSVTGSRIWGLFSEDGCLGGSLFIVADQQLYEVTEANISPSLVGTLPGTGAVVFAGDSTRLFLSREGRCFVYDGSTLTELFLPDSGDLFGDVGYINGYFLFPVLGSSKFYWLQPATNVFDPLDFASAERSPDAIVSIRIVSDEIWFLGKTNVEVWAPTGDVLAPFQRINGRVYSEGCYNASGAILATKNTLPCVIWVSAAKEVLLGQGGITKISNTSIEELLKDGETFFAWFFKRNRNDFYVLSCSTFTVVYDITNDLWYRWSSYSYPYWRTGTGTQKGSQVLAGDTESGSVWALEEGVVDGSDDFLVCEVSGWYPLTDKSEPCASVKVEMNSGFTSSYTYQPKIELRWSDTQGATWSDYIHYQFNDRGEYESSAWFRSLGTMRRPGRLFEFRFSELDNLRLDYVTLNEG